MSNSILDASTLISEVEDQLNINGYDIYTDPMLGALISPILELVGSSIRQVVNYYNRNVLMLASGSDLTEKVYEFGITKQNGAVPVDDTFTNFHVDIMTGIAKDYIIDINSPLVIPAEHVIITDINDNTYTINTPISINPDASSGYVGITGDDIIVDDIDANTITNITINYNYVSNLDTTKVDSLEFKCNNNKAIITTPGLLTDADVKDAAYLRIQSMNNSNKDAIILQLKKLGINDVIFKKDMFGAGTLGIILSVGNSSAISESAISIINNTVANVAPFARVVVPEVLKVRLTVESEYADVSKIDESKENIKRIIQEYFDSLILGQSLQPNAFINNVLESTENVTSLKCRCLFIDDRPALITNQTCLSDQVFEFDGDADNSILFTV